MDQTKKKKKKKKKSQRRPWSLSRPKNSGYSHTTHYPRPTSRSLQHQTSATSESPIRKENSEKTREAMKLTKLRQSEPI